MRISDLEPKEVFRFFEEISRIPRPSYHEEKISDYLVNFAKERGLFYVQDKLLNVIIIKEATPGYETQPPIILQGHMDMVCEKEAECQKDMEREGLELVTDGKEVWAKGTTLGGDDGIAIAYVLAVLDAKDLPHPRLEFVCTVCEEVGMDGAAALDVSCLKGKCLLNLDSEEEGVFLAGCAGGCTVDIRISEKADDSRMPEKEMLFQGSKTGGISRISEEKAELELEITGLTGGHSGTEIDKHRANANMLMLEWLGRLYDVQPFSCIALEGGSKDNAIPRSCIGRIALQGKTKGRPVGAETAATGKADIEAAGTGNADNVAVFVSEARRIAGEIEADWKQAESGICLNIRVCETKEESGEPKEGKAGGISEETGGEKGLSEGRFGLGTEQTGRLLKKLGVFPNGVISMCQEPAGLVETSLNLGVLRIKAGEAQLRYSLRSCVDQQLEFLIRQLEELTKRIGGTMKISGKYPAWEYRRESEFRSGLVCVYREMFGKTPEIQVIHAGVECGILAAKIPGLECVSMGPDIYDIHTPAERMNVASVQRMYEFLLEALKRKHV